MRHITIDWVARNLASWDALHQQGNRVPKPFPGRKTPTRVAWNITLEHSGEKRYDHNASINQGKDVFTWVNPTYEHLQYVGKPSRYRCLQLTKQLRRARGRYGFIVEFDKQGPVAYSGFTGAGGQAEAVAAYYAYHPQDNQDILLSFSKRIHMKRIGGLPVYSHIRKLAQDRVDQYYAWFEKTFRKRLRRPKQAGMILESAPLEAQDDV